jgi:hypothetical protein
VLWLALEVACERCRVEGANDEVRERGDLPVARTAATLWVPETLAEARLFMCLRPARTGDRSARCVRMTYQPEAPARRFVSAETYGRRTAGSETRAEQRSSDGGVRDPR